MFHILYIFSNYQYCSSFLPVEIFKSARFFAWHRVVVIHDSFNSFVSIIIKDLEFSGLDHKGIHPHNLPHVHSNAVCRHGSTEILSGYVDGRDADGNCGDGESRRDLAKVFLLW